MGSRTNTTGTIASLAHDLKTPLTVMQGNIDLLDETNLNEEQKLYLSYAMTVQNR